MTLYIALGAALQVTKGHTAPEVEHAYTQAYALCQQVGETLELGQVLFGLWRFYVVRPQLHTARELGDTLLRLAQRADDPALAVIAHYALGVTWFYLGALPESRQYLEDKPRQNILYTSAEINRLYPIRELPRVQPARGGCNPISNPLVTGALFLNHNYMQISGVFSSPSGVR